MANEIWEALCWSRLREVASLAVSKKTFRDKAKDPSKTQDTIEKSNDLNTNLDNLSLGRLDEEEIAFCIGWAKLALFSCPTDADLVAALNNEITGPPAG